MEAESWDGMCEKIHQRASWPLTMSWTTDIDLFYETPLWNVTVTGRIDTCHLISRHLKNCALKALREVQSGSSEVESTDKCSYGSCKKVKKWSQCRGSRGRLEGMLKYTISAQRQFEVVETGEVWFDCMLVLFWFDFLKTYCGEWLRNILWYWKGRGTRRDGVWIGI